MSRATSSVMHVRSIPHMKGVLEDFSKETLLAENINTVILSKLVKVAKNIEKFGNYYWLLLCPIAHCAGNMLSTTKNEASVKPHMEELSYILQQCLRRAKKSKNESLSPKTCKTLVPNLMLEIREMIQNKPKLKAFMLETLFEPLASLLTSSQLLLFDALESLAVLNSLLCGTNRGFRDSIRNQNMILIEGLVTRLTTCGDYEVQQGITEILLRLAPTEKRYEVSASWFHGNHMLINKFRNLGSKDFECECRDFLMTLNQSLGKDASVVTHECETVLIGNTKICKPKSDMYKSIFMDINKSSSSLTFCCSDEIHDAVLLRVKAKDLKDSSLLYIDDHFLQLTMKISAPFQELRETKLKNEVSVRIVFKKELTSLPFLLKNIFTPKIEIQKTLMSNTAQDDNENSMVPKIKRNQRVSEGIRLVSSKASTVSVMNNMMDTNLSGGTHSSAEVEKFAPLLSRNPADIPDDDSAQPSPEQIELSDKISKHCVTPKISNPNVKAKLAYCKTPYSHGFGSDSQNKNYTAYESKKKTDAAETPEELFGDLIKNVGAEIQCSTAKETESSKKLTPNKSAIQGNEVQEKTVEKENFTFIATAPEDVAIGDENFDPKENIHSVSQMKHRYGKNNVKNVTNKTSYNDVFENTAISNFEAKKNHTEKELDKGNSTQNSLATVAQLFQDPAPSKIRLSTRGQKKKSKLPHLEFIEDKINDSAVTPRKRRLYNSNTPVNTAVSENGKCTVQFNQTIKMKNSLHIEFNVTPKTAQNNKNPSNKPSSYSDIEELDSTLEKWRKKKSAPIKSYNNKNKKTAVKKRGRIDVTKNDIIPAKKICLEKTVKEPVLFESQHDKIFSGKKSRQQKENAKSKKLVGVSKNSPKKIEVLRCRKNSNNSLLKALEDVWSQENDDLPDLVIEHGTRIEPALKPATPPFLKMNNPTINSKAAPFSSSNIPSKKNTVRFNSSSDLVRDKVFSKEKSISPLPPPNPLSMSPPNFDIIKQCEPESLSPMSTSSSVLKVVLFDCLAKPHTAESSAFKTKEILTSKSQEKTQPLKNKKNIETQIENNTNNNNNANKKVVIKTLDNQDKSSKLANKKKQFEVEQSKQQQPQQEENKITENENVESTKKGKTRIPACLENMKDLSLGSKSNVTVVATAQENKQSLFRQPTKISNRVGKFFKNAQINDSSDNFPIGQRKLSLKTFTRTNKKHNIVATADHDCLESFSAHEDITLPENTTSNSTNEKTVSSKESISEPNVHDEDEQNNMKTSDICEPLEKNIITTENGKLHKQNTNLKSTITNVLDEHLLSSKPDKVVSSLRKTKMNTTNKADIHHDEKNTEKLSQKKEKVQKQKNSKTKASEQGENLLINKPKNDVSSFVNNIKTADKKQQNKDVLHDKYNTVDVSEKNEKVEKQNTSLKLSKANKQGENLLNNKPNKKISTVYNIKTAEKKQKNVLNDENVIAKSFNNSSLKQKKSTLSKVINLEDETEISSEEDFVPGTQFSLPCASTKIVAPQCESPEEVSSPVLTVNTPMTIPESPTITSSLSSINVSPVRNTSMNSRPIKNDILSKALQRFNLNNRNEREENQVLKNNAKYNKKLSNAEICTELESFEDVASNKPSKKCAKQTSDSSSETESEAEVQTKRKKRSYNTVPKPIGFRSKRQSNFQPKSSSTPVEDDTEEEIYKEKTGKKAPSYLNISLSPIKEVPSSVYAGNAEPSEDEDEQLLNTSALSRQNLQISYVNDLRHLVENWTQKTTHDITSRRCELVRRFLNVLDLEAEHAEDKIEELGALKIRQQKSMNLAASNFTKLKALLEDQQSNDVLRQQSARLQHRLKKQMDEALQTHSKELRNITHEFHKRQQQKEIQKLVTTMRTKLSLLF